MNKKILASLLACILAVTGIFLPVAAYAETESAGGNITTENRETTELNNNLTVKGTNSFGSLLEDKLSQEALEQQENQGCNIFSIEMTDKVANVSFETTMDATLVVAIYEDDGVKMFASAKTEVFAGETQASVDFEMETMPQYFYVRGFLVETENLQPLCISYESPMYTKEMQEFLAKGTDDFEPDRVLNLDEDTENNFAVYSEETIRIPKSENENQVVTADDGNNVYVIENADENISSLKKDDIFAYEYEENEILIVKVADVTMDGTTATITGTDMSMEEVFDYVKIDGESGIEDAVIDSSTCGEDVAYKGIVDYEDENELQTYAWEGENKKSHALSYEFLDKKDFSGSVELKWEGSVKYYISREYQYVELKLDYSGNLKISFKGKMFNKEIPLACLKISILPGINLEFTPSILIELSAKIEFTGKLTGCIGFRVSSDEGIRNLTSSPKLKSEVKGEVTLFVGLSVKPKIEIISDLLANATLEAKVGGEIKAEMTLYKKPSSSQVHGCTRCIDGDISGKAEVTFEVKLLNSDKLKYTYSIGRTVKLFDFYYSFTYGDFAFTVCPHYWYQTTVNVIDENGKKIANATIKTPFSVNKTQPNGTVTDVGNLTDVDHITTGEDGKAIGYLPIGKYTLAVSADGYEASTKKITVVDDDKEIVVRLKKKPEVVVPPVKPGGSEKVKAVSIGAFHAGAIMEDGSLYIWGYNIGDKEEKYITPVKVLEHVSTLEICGEGLDKESTFWESIAAIQEDGSLYMCGWKEKIMIVNEDRQSESGDKESNWMLKKILDHVETVKLTEYGNAAITKDKKLYLWGGIEYRQLENGTTDNSNIPVKVLDDVVFAEPGYIGKAITEDGSLYMWGGNYDKEGDVPVKVLDNVVSVSGNYAITKDGSLYDVNCTKEDGGSPAKMLDDVTSFEESLGVTGAITKDGSLYMWGYNTYGQLGNGTTEYSNEPIKVLDNAVSVDIEGFHGVSSAITKDGSLYMWGYNKYGELGNGTMENSSVPIKVLDHVVSVNVNYRGVCKAITKDGSLYMWGNNDFGELGNGTTENSSVPIKMLDHVVSVDSGGDYESISGAITKDGSLYIWGTQCYGKSSVLRRVLDDVLSVDINSNSAVTKDGILYTWGSWEDGSTVPEKALDNVTTISSGPEGWHYLRTTITKDGSLYMWGSNVYGQFGNGTTNGSSTPVKVNFPIASTASVFANESDENNVISTFRLPEFSDTEKAFTAESKNHIRSESNESSAVGNGIAIYSDLPPNEIYNFYIVKNKDAEDVLDPDNLLYIQQVATDETGKMQIPYLNADVESLFTAEQFIVSLRKTDISTASITVPNLKYDGTEQFVTPQVTYQGNTLVEGIDYELTSGYSAAESGTHTVTISGIGLYTGTLSADYQVVCNHAYRDNSTLVKATLSKNGTLKQKCSICGNTRNVPIYAVKTAKLSDTSYTYNGKANKPSVTLTDSKGTNLKINTDYSVSYASGRKNVGIYTVTITLKGRYSGTIKKTFTVKPKGTSISKISASKKGFTVKWKKQKSQTTGYELQYSTSSKFKGAKTLKNIKAKATSKKVTKLKARKKYYVRIRTYKTVKVNGKSTKVYSGWSKAKKVVTKK